MSNTELTAMLSRRDLSRRAKGLLLEMMFAHHPEGLTPYALWQAGVEGKHSVYGAILELEKHGYVSRPGRRLDPDTNRFVPGVLSIHMPPKEATL